MLHFTRQRVQLRLVGYVIVTQLGLVGFVIVTRTVEQETFIVNPSCLQVQTECCEAEAGDG